MLSKRETSSGPRVKPFLTRSTMSVPTKMSTLKRTEKLAATTWPTTASTLPVRLKMTGNRLLRVVITPETVISTRAMIEDSTPTVTGLVVFISPPPKVQFSIVQCFPGKEYVVNEWNRPVNNSCLLPKTSKLSKRIALFCVSI